MNILSFSDYHDRKALSRNGAQGRFFAKDTIDILRGSLYNRNKEGDGVSDVAKRIGGLLFEWDEEKARVNGQKHGISFETAAMVFQDRALLEFFDKIHSENEARLIAIGMVNDVVTVIYTERHEDTIRLISARKATARERRIYYEQFSGS
jgi:hypothetical protein